MAIALTPSKAQQAVSPTPSLEFGIKSRQSLACEPDSLREVFHSGYLLFRFGNARTSLGIAFGDIGIFAKEHLVNLLRRTAFSGFLVKPR